MLFDQSRRLARHAVIYGLGNVAGRFVGFILLPLYTRVIPDAELGALWTVVALVGLLTTVLALGMNSAIFGFYYQSEEPRVRERVVGTAFLTVTGASIVAVAAMWLLQPVVVPLLLGDEAYTPLLSLTLVLVFFTVGTIPPMAQLRAQERSITFALIGLGRFLVNLAVNLWLVAGLELGARGVLIGNLVTVALLYTGFLPMIARSVRAGFDGPLARKLIAFGAPIMVASLGSFALDSADVWILRWFHGLEEVSLYGTFYRIARIVQVLVVQPFVLAWPAIMWTVAARPGADVLFSRMLTYVVAATSFIAAGVALFTPELVTLFATEERIPEAPVLFLLAFAFVPFASQFVLNAGVSLERKTGYIAKSVGWGVLVNLILNLLLIPRYAMLGAAAATLVAYVAVAVTITLYGRRVHRIDYEWKRVAWIAIVVPLITYVGTIGDWPLAARIGWWALPALLIVNPFFLSRREWNRLRHPRAKGEASES